MKKFTVIVLGMLAFGFASTSYCVEISLTDYKVPVSSMSDLSLGLSYNYYDGPIDDTGLSKTADDVTDKGKMSLVYRNFYESLPFGYTIDLTGIGARDVDAEDEFTHNLAASVRGKKYLFPERPGARLAGAKDFFGYGKMEASSATEYENIASTLTVGVGYGRFINATPLARAIRIEEELRKENALTADIPKATLLELAKLLTPEKKDEFKTEYKEVWEKYYFMAIEELLVGAGVVEGNQLGAVAVLRIKEVLDEVVHDRYYGYEVSGGVGYELSDPYQDETRDPIAEFGVKYARPISIRTQANEIVSMSTPFTEAFGKDYTINSTTSVSYELAKHIDFIVSYVLGAKKRETQDSPDLSHSLNATYVFYVEAKTNVSVTGSLQKAEGDKEVTKSIGTMVSYDIF